MINEIVYMSALFFTGSLFISAFSLGRFASPTLGFIAGTAIQITVGTLLLMTTRPILPVIVALCSFTASIVLLLFMKRSSLIRSLNLTNIFKCGVYTIASVLFVSVAVGLLFNEGWAKYSSDSFRYLKLAHEMSHDGVTVFSGGELITGLFGASLMHLPATMNRELYVRSVFPILSVSVILALMWFIYRGCQKRVNPTKTIIFMVLAGLLLISINRYVFTSFYIHTHMICAAMTLVVSACGWLMIHDKKEYQSGYLAVLSVALFALIVTRAESAIIGIFLLIPLISSEKTITIRQKQVLLLAYGIPTTLYYGFVIFILGGNISDIINADILGMGSFAPIIYCMLGILAICLAFLLKVLYNLKLFAYLAGRATIIAECGLWLFLLIYYVTDAWLLRLTITAFYYLFVVGEGAWGLSVVFLAIVTLLILLFVKNPEGMTALRFPVTIFVPIMMVSTHLQGGPPRVGPGGSFNRMLIQIVPLLVLFIIMSAALGESRFFKRNDANEEIQVDEEKTGVV